LCVLRIRQNATVTVNTNNDVVANVVGDFGTQGLDPEEYRRFHANLKNRFNKFRFVGASLGIIRTADKSMVSTSSGVDPNQVINTLSIVNQKPARMRAVQDTYHPTGFTDIIDNDVGMDNSANIRHVPYRKFVKIAKFKVSQNIIQNRYKRVDDTNVLPAPAATVPGVIANKTVVEIMRQYYPQAMGNTAVVELNIPNQYLLNVDSFPQTPVPTAAGNQSIAVTGFSFTIYKNFYFEALGRDANGNDA
jgi:hypothetical protein